MKRLLIAFATIVLMYGCKDAEKKEATAPKADGQVNFPVTQREIFSLSMISNLPAAIAWPYDFKILPQNFDDSVITYITPLMDSTLLYASDNSTGTNFTLNNWKRVWGPAVIVDTMCDLCNTYTKTVMGKTYTFDARGRVPVSSMTIFRDQNGNYVVGIEATNPSSVTDWVDLDMNVMSKQPFDGNSAHGNLSQGTYNGLNNYLLLLTDMKTNQTAMQFLDTITKASTITVTGHSLGGALSPVFALYLKNNLANKNFNNQNIYCLATAGASPGDTTFIGYFNQQMQNYTVRIWNSMDVVPHAWEPDTMRRINGIYQNNSGSIRFDAPFSCTGDTVTPTPFNGMPTPGDIAATVIGLADKVQAANLQYGSICQGGQTFTGTQQSGNLYFNTTMPAQPSPFYEKYPNDMTFLDQLGNQHVAAYTMYFQIVGIHNYMHSWVTGGRVKNSVAYWNCAPYYRKCEFQIPINPLGANDPSMEKAAALWGQIHKAAWKW